MREENVQRNSRKRLNALILLVAFTAILLIVATYAWFSTQKNVTLGGLEGQVNVAEGLQISLDALNWASEIDLTDNASAYFAQTNTNNGWTDDDMVSLVNPWKQGSGGTYTYQARTNLVPSELLPASTTAQSNEGIGLNDLNYYRGEVESGKKLTKVAKLAAEADSGYYAIDFFLQNSSSTEAITGKTKDLLRIESNSSINLNEASRESTGLQNTFRVAFAIFDEDSDSDDVTLVNNTPSQADILQATTGPDRLITDVAIWEPNASGAQAGTSPSITTYAAHVDYIVQNNNRLTLSSTDRTSLTSGTSRFDADDPVPTYALTSTSVSKTIADIYDWDTNAATNGLVKQNTVQTPNTGIVADNPVQLKSVKDGTTDFAIEPGKYIHMRMYVWLEGQDVDCINYASLGGGLTIDVGLSKPGSATDGIGG